MSIHAGVKPACLQLPFLCAAYWQELARASYRWMVYRCAAICAHARDIDAHTHTPYAGSALRQA